MVARRCCSSRRARLCALGLVSVARGDFVYVDFNETQGLTFNGAALTSACRDVEEHRAYGSRESDNPDGSLGPFYGEDQETSSTSEVKTQTRDASMDSDLALKEQVLYHRDNYRQEDRRCAGRVRLTPSQPHARGSVWYHQAVPVVGGFETTFGFKISDHSRECTRHRDLDFSLQLYENCHVHGGDGIAFVVHADPNGTATLGEGGGQIGFGGVRSSIAVELDTSYNPESDFAPVDHVAVRSRGPGEPNSAHAEDALLAPNVVHELADGREHFVKVAYLPRVAMEYFSNFSATTNAAKYAVDAGEQRRVGTFLVYIDDGIAADKPSTAFPINLPELLGLDGQGEAFVGFTSSTGRRWEKHDLTAWHVCDREDCLTQPSSAKDQFDYHTVSRNASHYQPFKYSPNPGFGGAVHDFSETLAANGPTQHTSPDRDPITPPLQHFADGRLHGLAVGAAMQAPPNTEF